MSTLTREALLIVLLTTSWVTTTLGIATADWRLVGASLPSLALATVLHLVGVRSRRR